MIKKRFFFLKSIYRISALVLFEGNDSYSAGYLFSACVLLCVLINEGERRAGYSLELFNHFFDKKGARGKLCNLKINGRFMMKSGCFNGVAYKTGYKLETMVRDIMKNYDEQWTALFDVWETFQGRQDLEYQSYYYQFMKVDPQYASNDAKSRAIALQVQNLFYM